MTDYTVTIDTTNRNDYTDTETDTLLDTLTPIHGTIGLTPDGHRTATVTINTTDTTTAHTTALAAVVDILGGDPLHVEATRADVHDARDHGIQDYLAATAAAEELGISRQRVVALVNQGTLPGHTIAGTRTIVIPRSAIRARQAAMATR